MPNRRHFLTGVTALGTSTFWPRRGTAKTTRNDDTPVVLRATEVHRKLEPSLDQPSRLFLYNGDSPGPTIRGRRGERIRVLFENDLSVPSTIHWHGIRLENQMDGVPGLTQSPVLPGESHQYEFTVPDAGTYWYHAHFNSLEQVARGLYGPLIIQGDADHLAGLEDVVLVLDDWWVGKDGRFVDGFSDWMQGKPGGRIGNIFTLNGAPPGTRIEVPTGQAVRLRLINSANAREFFLDFQQLNASVVAVDGQALPRPIRPQTPLRLGPAQRIDVIFIQGGDNEVNLIEASGTLGAQSVLATFASERSSVAPIKLLPLKSNKLTEPDRSKAVQIPFIMTGGSPEEIDGAIHMGERRNSTTLSQSQQIWAFNDIANLPEAPLFSVERGTSVRLLMENRTGWSHAMHVHGHHFRVIDAGDELSAEIWRDTVMIDRNQELEIAFVADNPGRWLLHCHMLQHAISGMRTWFEVS